VNQERIVLIIAIALFAFFSIGLNGFLSPANIWSLIQNVSILGILGVGMAIAIIGRGIDLSMVATMALSVAWLLGMMNSGMPIGVAVLWALGFAVLVGLVNGLLIAYVEIPAIFATLAMGILVYGFGKTWLVNVDVAYLPAGDSWFYKIGSGQILGVPTPVILFAAVSFFAFLFLRYLTPGRFIYGMGDNPLAARITGIPVRPMIVLQYVLNAIIAFIAGLVTATAVSSMNTRVALSTLVYDVILVVVLGGIGLSGGKGGIRNVIVGTLLIGILLNGMTIMNLTYTMQNILKSVILLAAIIIDTILNPRDEQTAQHGDI
jgi:ribose transport system permease protein